MATPFETFVNTELPKRLATNVSPTAPQAGEVPVFTGVGLLTENKSLAAAGIQAALANVITAGTYGSSTQYAIPTFNAKGLCTGVTLQTVNTTLTEANFAVEKTGEPANKITWNLSALTAPRVHTMPDKAINFGTLSSVATTDSNVLSGTRTRIVGGSSNTVSGTDNSIINSSSNTVSGTGNTITGGVSNTVSSVTTCTGNTLINCIALRLGTVSGVSITGCTFTDVKNNYTTPEAPLNFSQPQNECTFTGWLNDGVVITPWPKGYSIKGQKRKILGAFGFSGSAYISHIDAVVELAAVSSTGSSQLKVQKDPTKAPVASNSGFYQDGFTEYTLTFFGYNPTANQRVTGTRVLRESNGVITDVTPPSMASTVTNGFNLSLSVSVTPQSGYQGLIINVRNLASIYETQWVATLESKIVHVSFVP